MPNFSATHHSPPTPSRNVASSQIKKGTTLSTRWYPCRITIRRYNLPKSQQCRQLCLQLPTMYLVRDVHSVGWFRFGCVQGFSVPRIYCGDRSPRRRRGCVSSHVAEDHANPLGSLLCSTHHGLYKRVSLFWGSGQHRNNLPIEVFGAKFQWPP